MKKLLLFMAVVTVLSPLTVLANHQTTRVCMDPLDPTVVSVNIYARTSVAGVAVVKNVLRAGLVSDAAKCTAPAVGVLLGSLGLPDNSTYFIKATSLDAGGHESVLSAEASGTPTPLSSTLPPGVTGLVVR